MATLLLAPAPIVVPVAVQVGCNYACFIAGPDGITAVRALLAPAPVYSPIEADVVVVPSTHNSFVAGPNGVVPIRALLSAGACSGENQYYQETVVLNSNLRVKGHPIPTHIIPVTTPVVYGAFCNLADAPSTATLFSNAGVGFGIVASASSRSVKASSFQAKTFLLIKELFSKVYCAVEVTADLFTTMDYLDEEEAIISLIKSFGYSLDRNSDNQGEVDHTTKTVNYIGGGNGLVTLAVLTHELVHILEHKGLVSHKDIPTIQNLLPKDGTHLYDEDLTRYVHFDWTYGVNASEDLAYSLMTWPIAVMEFVDSLIPSSATGDVVTTQRVEDVISSCTTKEQTMVLDVNAKVEAVWNTIQLLDDGVLEEADLYWMGLKTGQLHLNHADKLQEIAENPFKEGSSRPSAALKKAVKYCDVLSHYVAFNVHPFPFELLDAYEEVVLVDEFVLGGSKFKDAIYAAGRSGVPLRFATSSIDWSGGLPALVIEGSDRQSRFTNEKAYKSIAAWEPTDKKVVFISSNSSITGQTFEGAPIWSVEHLYALSILSLVTKMNLEEKVAFLGAFGWERIGDTLRVTKKGVAAVASYTQLTFDFDTLTIESGSNFKVRHGGFLSGFGEFDSANFMVLFALEVGSMSSDISQRAVDGIIAGLTELWEDKNNYGSFLDEFEQLAVIRKNTWAILRIPSSGEYKSVEDGKSFADNGEFPYFRMWNNNNKSGVDEAINYCLENQIEFWPDKNCIKRITTGAGVAAYYASIDYKEMIVKTFLDVAKAGKLFSRGPNAVAIAAAEGIKGLPSYREYLNSALAIEHIHNKTGERTVIRVKGDRRLTLAHNGKYNNGSGVAISWGLWAFSVPKTLRGTFDSMDLKPGEDIFAVANEIQLLLNEALQDDRTIDGNEGGVVFAYRGRDILDFKALNQVIRLGAEYATGSVKVASTSRSIAISATVTYFATDRCPKARSIAMKATLADGYATDAKVLNEVGTVVDVEVSLNAECLKGNGSRVSQYAHAMQEKYGKECLVNVAQELLRVPMGEGGEYVDVSLADETSHFYTWWRENQKTYYVQNKVEFYHFCYWAMGHSGVGGYTHAHANDFSHGIWPIVDGQYLIDWNLLWTAYCTPFTQKGLTMSMQDKLTVLNAEGIPVTSAKELEAAVEETNYTLLTVREEVRGVLAPMTFQIELASVREAGSRRQSSTLQQLTSTYVVNPDLGRALLRESSEVEDGILSMVATAINNPGIEGIEASPALSKTNSMLEEKISADLLSAKLIATRYNQSTFGISGPRFYSLNEDPFLAFSEDTGDKFEPQKLMNRVGISEEYSGGEDYTFEEARRGTSEIYSFFVGTCYGISSTSTVAGALERYAMEKAEMAGDAALYKHHLANLKVTARVSWISWIASYEDAALCGFTLKGMALSEALQAGMKGGADKNTSEERQAALSAIIDKLVDKLKDVSGIEFSRTEVALYLKYFQMVRALSAFERYDSKGDGSKIAKKLGFTQNDIQLLAISGAYRRCDQGSFGNFVDFENDGQKGTSIWRLLESLWPEIQDRLPYFLRRKLFKACIVQLTLADTRKAKLDIVDDVTEQSLKVTMANVSTVFSDNEKVAVVTTVFNENTKAVPILAETAYSVKGLNTLPELVDEAAFEYRVLACPLSPSGVGPNLVAKHGAVDGVYYYPSNQLLTTKEILERASWRYPEGVVLYSEESAANGDPVSCYFNFEAVLSCSAIYASGSSTGFALRLAQFMVSICRPAKDRQEHGFSNKVRETLSSLQGQANVMMKSGLLRRFGRTRPNAQGAKIRPSATCYDRIIDGYQIPMIRMNPTDGLVRAGRYMDGDWVCISRTPQIAEIYGVMQFSEEVEVGYIECNAALWAMGNHGDGDGDGVSIKNLSYLVNRKV